MDKHVGIEEAIKVYEQCDKKDRCQLSDKATYLCDDIRPCTYIHYFKNRDESSISIQDIVYGLEDLKNHCDSMHCEKGDVWEKDILVLNEAIKIISLLPYK